MNKLTKSRIQRKNELIKIMANTKSQEKKELCEELINVLNKLINKKKKWYKKIF